MALKIYNTRTRQKEEFVPAHSGKVNLYVCGVTVYDECHVGHARVYVVFDLVTRYLEHLGYQVRYVRNITDVDDKIIDKARAEAGKGDLMEAVRKVTSRYTEKFQEALKQLGLRPPQLEPRATENIDEMIWIIQQLEKKGIAYTVDGDVYFDISKWKKYGVLSRRSLDEMKAGARVEVDSRKRSPLDFALWKKGKPEEPQWESPWGKGRPGWHIECSAMSMKYLGTPVDIHGGGQDLIFPHHENELAQSEAATGKEFVRFWMHNGFVTINKEKMSKSLGNFFILQDVFKKFSPRVVHFYLLSQHYRTPLEFSDLALEEAREGLEKIGNCLALTEDVLRQKKLSIPALSEKQKSSALASFETAMDDDFNTSRALAVLFDLVSQVNSARESGQLGEDFLLKVATLKKILGVLGVEAETPEIARVDLRGAAGGPLDSAQLKGLLAKKECSLSELEELARERERLRAKKQFADADAIRKKISEAGYRIEDTPSGPRLRKE